MKYFLILIILLQFHYSNGQQSGYDSLNRRISFIQNEQQSMKINLSKYQDQSKLGSALMFFGSGLIIIDLLQNRGSRISSLSFSGGLIATIGCVIHVDSFKWIKRGNKKRIKR